jgi:hypothetical protein
VLIRITVLIGDDARNIGCYVQSVDTKEQCLLGRWAIVFAWFVGTNVAHSRWSAIREWNNKQEFGNQRVNENQKTNKNVEECRLLGCYAICLLYYPTFRRNVSPTIIRVTRMGRLGTTLAVTSSRRTLRRNTRITRRCYDPPKRRLSQEPDDVTSQNTEFLIVTAMITEKLTKETFSAFRKHWSG